MHTLSDELGSPLIDASEEELKNALRKIGQLLYDEDHFQRFLEAKIKLPQPCPPILRTFLVASSRRAEKLEEYRALLSALLRDKDNSWEQPWEAARTLGWCD